MAGHDLCSHKHIHNRSRLHGITLHLQPRKKTIKPRLIILLFALSLFFFDIWIIFLIPELEPNGKERANYPWHLRPGNILDELLVDISGELVVTKVVTYDVVHALFFKFRI